MTSFSRRWFSLGVLLALTSCSNDSDPASSSGADPGPEADAGLPPDAGGGGGGIGGSGGSEEDGGGPPPTAANVVFILVDDFSLNLLEYMPNLLKMQADGITFANYFVTDSLCCPSRTSILTGKFPHDSGVFTNGGNDGGYAKFKSKGNETQTFATSLSAAGYRTALMGKYLNGYDPEVLAVPAGWTEWAVAGAGYKNFDYDLNQTGTLHHYGTKKVDYMTDVLAGLGVAFVGKEPTKNFLLEISTFTPHSPYTPAPRHEDAFPGLKIPKTPAYDALPGPNAPSWLAEIAPLTAEAKAKMEVSFRMRAQSVLAIDEMIGALQDAVAAAGKADSTYFVFSADNGYHMGEHSLRPGKQTAFDTDIHVPLIITGPGVPAGKTLEEIVQNIDLCSTFAEMGLTDPPPGQTGRSLVPLLRGETIPDFRDVALIEHHGENFDPTDPDAPEANSGNPPTYSALRTKSSVFVEYVGGELEYYDHTTDPYELDNIAGSLTAAEKQALKGTLEAMKNCHDAASCWTAQHMLPGAP